MNHAFDNEKYLKLQVEKINERVERFGNKLYLEFGGKIFDDFHASRTLPGFWPNAKIKALSSLKDRVEIVIVINAGDIQNGKMRSDLGLSYDDDVLRLIEVFNDSDLFVGSVVITQYARQMIVDMFKARLENRGIKVYLHYYILGYPSNIELILSSNGFGKNDYIETTKPIVVVAAPGSGSGKMATCLSQLYHENMKGISAGYAKYETFPIWNLPLKHPVNLAYEAATADIKDALMIDSFHLEAYQQIATNYNRDIEVFPILQAIFKHIYGYSPYLSPTEMGINSAGECIIDDEIARNASKQEIIRRYLDARCDLKNGIVTEETVDKIAFIMSQVGVTVDDRLSVKAALTKAEKAKVPSMAMELADKTMITGKTTNLLDASAATIINALKYYAHIEHDLKLISPFVIEPIQALKYKYLGSNNQRLHVYEVLIALSMNAMTNPMAEKALKQLPKLANAQAHSTIMLSSDDLKLLKKLRIDITAEPILRRINHTNF